MARTEAGNDGAGALATLADLEARSTCAFKEICEFVKAIGLKEDTVREEAEQHADKLAWLQLSGDLARIAAVAISMSFQYLVLISPALAVLLTLVTMGMKYTQRRSEKEARADLATFKSHHRDWTNSKAQIDHAAVRLCLSTPRGEAQGR
jgi:hypothetical protein